MIYYIIFSCSCYFVTAPENEVKKYASDIHQLESDLKILRDIQQRSCSLSSRHEVSYHALNITDDWFSKLSEFCGSHVVIRTSFKVTNEGRGISVTIIFVFLLIKNGDFMVGRSSN